MEGEKNGEDVPVAQNVTDDWVTEALGTSEIPPSRWCKLGKYINAEDTEEEE